MNFEDATPEYSGQWFDATGANPYADVPVPKGTEEWGEMCAKLIESQNAIRYVDFIHFGEVDGAIVVREKSIVTGKWKGWYMFRDDRFSPSLGTPLIASDKMRFFVDKECATEDELWTVITEHHALLYRAFKGV
jgi:hypothetical protein